MHSPRRKQCGAKTRSGEPCKNWGMENGRCRMHRGKARKGMAVHSFKDGRYSKYMPQRLVETYQASVTDPEILNLSQEIAVLDTRMNDLMKRVDTGESGLIWTHLKATYADLQAAQRERDTLAVGKLLAEIGQLINRGNADFATWREITALMDQRRKLVEAERKRRTEMQSMITAEKAMALFKALSDSVIRRVEDADVRNAILDEFRALVDS